ncbi:protein FAM111A-like [Mastacembelus armatus]|uniref:Protein FAM111A-like n=1 Tax=Mastacembelus armatus TaxID=205130 RepID=A0A3Q3RY81_9TELE|nr:protein FAM111A-like [Mastacembelus armatus]XP_026178283.1 protein FAM111A-like [Mastacembelus armatus]
MPPKKQNTKDTKNTQDIRSFLSSKRSASPGSNKENSQPGGATAPQTDSDCNIKVKQENDTDPHRHHFTVKFDSSKSTEHTFTCVQPCTVLEAIKSCDEYKKMKFTDEKITIKLGKSDKKYIVATHFPCICIEEDQCLTISRRSEQIEKREERENHCDKMIYPRDQYSVFYIDTQGGVNTETKTLFRSNIVKKFKCLCVYGKKGTTVEAALKRDGRFVDDLGNFHLSDNEVENLLTHCTQVVDNLNHKEFKIRLPKYTSDDDEEQHESSNCSQQLRKCDIKTIVDEINQGPVSVKTALTKTDGSDNTEEIYNLLREQFQCLKKWMESRFPGESYQEAVNLRKEDFGKIQASFSEVFRVRKLLNLSRSICRLRIVCSSVTVHGTGFVLFDNYIMTNAHLFTNHAVFQTDDWIANTTVTAVFNCENPDERTWNFFKGRPSVISLANKELDYVVLKLNPQGQNISKKTKKRKINVPPGLLNKFSPMPPNGEACVIGHPGGSVKKMDPTCIIEKEKREEAVNNYLNSYKDTMFTFLSIRQQLKDQGIENIMMGGNEADKVVTYNTLMYHGSSGSPVFDASCRVFGLHSSGFVYGHPGHTESVIELAHPLLNIFKSFVTELRDNGNEDLLNKVKEAAKGNQYLENILKDVVSDTEEPMETE